MNLAAELVGTEAAVVRAAVAGLVLFAPVIPAIVARPAILRAGLAILAVVAHVVSACCLTIAAGRTDVVAAVAEPDAEFVTTARAAGAAALALFTSVLVVQAIVGTIARILVVIAILIPAERVRCATAAVQLLHFGDAVAVPPEAAADGIHGTDAFHDLHVIAAGVDVFFAAGIGGALAAVLGAVEASFAPSAIVVAAEGAVSAVVRTSLAILVRGAEIVAAK